MSPNIKSHLGRQMHYIEELNFYKNKIYKGNLKQSFHRKDMLP